MQPAECCSTRPTRDRLALGRVAWTRVACAAIACSSLVPGECCARAQAPDGPAGSAPSCPGDLYPVNVVADCTDSDGVVDVGDLAQLISVWGPCPDCCDDIFPPLLPDGVVDAGDLGTLLANWGECPVCGNAEAGTCFVANSSPGCNFAPCCTTVCELEPACCSDAWDSQCATLALAECGNCGDPAAGECGSAHATPGCSDAACCAAVCIVDSFCCEFEWDEACALQSAASCSSCGDPNAGSCYEADSTPYCNDAACCETVCAVDSYCCEFDWDIVCAEEAAELCDVCGSATSGDCFVVHASAGCELEDCCLAVCIEDPSCCADTWDAACVETAELQCATCGFNAAGPCFEPNKTPACDDENCCKTVCAVEPSCCTDAWDALCVTVALNECANCGNDNPGSCFEEHPWPGCEDASCCAAVCIVDSYCCEVQWDFLCVGEAEDICDP